jgi:hypothetical protein
MSGRSFRRAATRTALVGLLAVALVPLHSLPVAAATTPALKPGNPEKSAPLGEGKAKTVIPEVQKGDFANPPSNDALESLTPGDKPEPTADRSRDKRDHFDTNTSKLVERSKFSNKYANADGTTSEDISGTPVNFQDRNGNWQPIDASVKIDAKSRDISNASGPVQYSLENNPTAAKIATLDVNGKTVSFGLDRFVPGTKARIDHVEGDIARDLITYPAAIDGADLTYTFVGTRLKEAIVLPSAPSSAPTYRFPLTFDGLHATTRDDGTIVFRDDANADVIVVDPATMWDSSGTAERVPVTTTLSPDGKAIELRPDFAWISSPSRQFPLVIDPTYDGWQVNSGGWMDAFVHKYYANTNYDSFYQSGAYTDQVGYDSYPAGENYTYMYEEMGGLNGKQILDARWRALVFGHSATCAMRVYPVVPSSWGGNTITWNNQPGHRPDYASVLPPPNSWTNLDITSWVNNWTNGTWQNSGLSIDTAGCNSFYRLAANENGWGYGQYIHVTYNDAPTPGQPTAPDDAAQLMTTTPTLTGTTGTDPNGDTLKYWFRVSNTNNPELGQVINSGWLNSPTWTIPTGSLIDGVTTPGTWARPMQPR